MKFKAFALANIIFFLSTISYFVKAEEDLAKQSQNPIGNIISLPFENTTYFDSGPTEKTTNVLNIKPVYPINIGTFNLINRGIIPVIYQEGQDSELIRRRGESGSFGQIRTSPGTHDEFGIGNIQYQGYFSPAEPGK